MSFLLPPTHLHPSVLKALLTKGQKETAWLGSISDAVRGWASKSLVSVDLLESDHQAPGRPRWGSIDNSSSDLAKSPEGSSLQQELDFADFSLKKTFALIRVGSTLLALFAANSTAQTLSLSAKDRQSFVNSQIIDIEKHFRDFKADYESLLKWQTTNAMMMGSPVSSPPVPLTFRALQNDKNRIAGLVEKATSIEDLCLVLWDSFVRDFNHHHSEAINMSQPIQPPSTVSAIVALAATIRDLCETASKINIDSKDATPPSILLTTSEILVLTDLLCQGITRLQNLPQNTIDAVLVTGGCDLYPFLTVEIASSVVDLVSLMSKTTIRHQSTWSRVNYKPAFAKWTTHINTLGGILQDTLHVLENDEVITGHYKPSQKSRRSIMSQNSTTTVPTLTTHLSQSTLADSNRKSTQSAVLFESIGLGGLSRSPSGSSTIFGHGGGGGILTHNIPLSVVVESLIMSGSATSQPSPDEIGNLPVEYRTALRRYTSVEDLSSYLTKPEQMQYNLKRWRSLLLDLSIPYVTGEFVLNGDAGIEGVSIDYTQLLLSQPKMRASHSGTNVRNAYNGYATKQRAKLRLGIRSFSCTINTLFTNLLHHRLDPAASMAAVNSKKLAINVVVGNLMESVKTACLEFMDLVKQIEDSCLESLNKRHTFRAAMLAVQESSNEPQHPNNRFSTSAVRELMLMQSLNRIDASEEDVKLALDWISSNPELLLKEPVSCCFSLVENVKDLSGRIEKLIGMVLVEEQIVDDVVKAGDDGIVVLDESDDVVSEAIGGAGGRDIEISRQSPVKKRDSVNRPNFLAVLNKSSEHIIFETVISSRNGQRVLDPNDVRVKYATLPKLVQQLSKNPALDAPFVLSFLQTYSTFITTSQLLDMLENQLCLLLSIPESMDPVAIEERRQDVIVPTMLSLLNFLHLWVVTVPLDFHADETFEKMASLVETVMERGTDCFSISEDETKFVSILRQDLVDNKTSHDAIKALLEKRVDTLPLQPVQIQPNSTIANIYALFLKTDPRVIAEQLAFLDFEIYNRIQPIEILGYTSRNRSSIDDVHSLVYEDQSFGSVSALLNRFNFLVSYVTSLIVQGSTVKARSDMIVLFVRVAKHCVDINALNAAQAIVSSLASASVYRLTRTWDNVPKPTHTLLRSLRVCFSPSLNFHNLRVLLSSVESNVLCIPWLGLFFRDIIHIAESHPVHKNVAVGSEGVINMINYDRCWMLSKAIDSALRFQTANMDYIGVSPAPGVRDALLRMDGLLATANSQFEASLVSEPVGDRTKSILGFLGFK
ncbi:UNVERIFIED_CONTAM: hypothetical protein HDU68_009204 [Siphonaria sp. JEL0065]|nr:hypothetical protein HDU68_009204 [Siphonaria sp. JEL0065]